MDLVKIRANFLYGLRRFVEAQVNDRMKELLKFEFNGESIWDDWDQSRIIEVIIRIRLARV